MLDIFKKQQFCVTDLLTQLPQITLTLFLAVVNIHTLVKECKTEGFYLKRFSGCIYLNS